MRHPSRRDALKAIAVASTAFIGAPPPSFAQAILPIYRTTRIGYFGDSTTNSAQYSPGSACEGATNFICSQRIEDEIAVRLAASGFGGSIFRHGFNGSSANDLDEGGPHHLAFKADLSNYRFDLVILNFGINDAIGNTDWSVFINRLAHLKSIAESYGAKVIYEQPNPFKNGWNTLIYPLTQEKCDKLESYITNLDSTYSSAAHLLVNHGYTNSSSVYRTESYMSDDIHPNWVHYAHRAENIAASIRAAALVYGFPRLSNLIEL